MLDKEFKFYIENQADLVEKYNGKYLVIKGNKVIGVHDSDEDAYFKTIDEHKPGTFLIQFCSPGDSSYTQTYHSRVIFN
jgi:hypothetical protein